MNKISVALLTFNEEDNVAECLESVKWADEIILVDEKSSDKTVSIVKKYTKNIFLVDHDPMFHKNKQYALEKCTGDWILQIDADEVVTPELKTEILTIINNEKYIGYQIPRKNRIFGKYMEHTGWYPDYQVKLFKNGKGHYPCKTVHELIEISGEVGTLKNDFLHHHYNSISQFLARLDKYTTNDAQYLLKKGEKINWTDAVKFPADEFFRRFFLWEGYKDGLHGLVLSLLQAFSRLIVFAKIWEKQNFWEYGDKNFLKEVKGETKKVRKDWNHWLMVGEKNLLLKTLRKFKNRLPL